MAIVKSENLYIEKEEANNDYDLESLVEGNNGTASMDMATAYQSCMEVDLVKTFVLFVKILIFSLKFLCAKLIKR